MASCAKCCGKLKKCKDGLKKCKHCGYQREFTASGKSIVELTLENKYKGKNYGE